jgi:hypothetical protein
MRNIAPRGGLREKSQNGTEIAPEKQNNAATFSYMM